jgi:Mg2+/Co2+ transporter CorB
MILSFILVCNNFLTIFQPAFICELACSITIGWSGEILFTSVQILILAPFPKIFPDFTGVMR